VSSQGVVSLDEYREQNGIKHLLGQAWPASRREFLAARREQADLGLRVTVCAFCGASSPELDGPMGRAWFHAHTTSGDCTQKAIL